MARVPVRIRTKLLVALAAMVLLVLGVGVLGQLVVRESNDRLETLARLQQSAAAYRVLQSDHTALQQMVAARAGSDVERLVGETVPARKESMESILSRLRDFYELGRLQYVPTPEERSVLRQIEADYERFVAAMTGSLELDRAGKAAEAEQLLVAEAKPLLTRLGRSTDQLANQAESAVAAVAAENRAAFVNSRRIFLLSAAGAILLALILSFAISSALIGPVQRMDVRLGEIASGDFSGRVDVPNRDELGTLAANLNRMNDELGRLYQVVEDQAAALRGWNEQLEARVAEQAAELQASRARIVATADAERRKIERDLHDGAQQHLVALSVNLHLARSSLADDPEAAAEMLDSIVADVRTATAELRALAHGIYPPVLRDSGLAAALRVAADRSSLDVSIMADEMGRHPPELEATVYFCCVEALQNTAKHAPGATVTIRTWEEADTLHFEVADTGPGFDTSAVTPGHGFVNLVDRVAALGGEAGWESSPGHGTRVSGLVPLAS